MPPLFRFALGALIVLLVSVQLRAEPRLQPVIDAGGAVVEPVALGNLVYIASGAQLQVHDYSDPAEPKLSYRTVRQPTPGRIVGIARRDHRLFVAWNTVQTTSGVWIYDIAEPTRPAKAGELEISDTRFGAILQSIAIVGDYLYALDAEAGLRVAHITDDGAPSSLDRAVAADSFPGIAMLHSNGTHLIGSGFGFLPQFSLVSFDLTQPERPSVGDARSTDPGQFRLVGDGNLGLLIAESYTLIDISDPLKIVERGRFAPAPDAFDGVLIGSVVHVIDGSSMSFWDATDPDHPVPATTGAIPLAGLQAALVTGFGALLIDRADQIVALDLGIPLAPVVASTTALLAGTNPSDIGFFAETPLMLHQSRGLGVHAPTTYAETARLPDNSNPIGIGQSFERIELRDEVAVMINWSEGISLADVSDPSRPLARGRVQFPFLATLALKGDYAFAGKVTNGGELAVFDIADPGNPQLINRVATSQTFDLAIRGDLLYSAEGSSGGEGGLWIFDVSNPGQPFVLAKLTGICDDARGIDVDAERALAMLACGSDGRLLIIDVSNPTQPQLLSDYASSPDFNIASSVRLSGSYALFGHDLGLDLVDLRNPRTPVRLDRQTTPFFVTNVRVFGERIFSFNALGGMREFRLTELPIPGAGHSAAWFDPARDGEGWTLEMLADGSALLYWFTYDELQRQRWLIGIGEVHGNRVEFPQMQVTSGGKFGPGFNPHDVVRTPAGSVTLVFDDCSSGAFAYSAFGQAQVIESTKLSRTMRIDCDPPTGSVDDARALQSGSWFDPAFDGQGFSLQWMASGEALLVLYTYDADGNQFWMIGVGQSDGDAVVFPSLTATRGARFGRGFDATAVERFDWGVLRLQLGCDDGLAEFDSPLAGFGSGEFALKRLSSLTGLGCSLP